MSHTTGGTSQFDLDLLIVVDREAFGLPSILGRDILFRGGRQGVTFDVEAGEHEISG